MNREKLLAKARNNPKGLRFTEICQLAEAFGYQLRRQRGSHRMYRRDDVPERLNFQPDQNNMAKDYQVRQLLRYINEYGGLEAIMHDDHYRIELFWYEPDQCWIADVPDLRYCSAHGDTPEEALAEVQIAKELWLEDARETGEALPQPSPSPAMMALIEATGRPHVKSATAIA